jgi:hypothetical protein
VAFLIAFLVNQCVYWAIKASAIIVACRVAESSAGLIKLKNLVANRKLFMLLNVK